MCVGKVSAVSEACVKLSLFDESGQASAPCWCGSLFTKVVQCLRLLSWLKCSRWFWPFLNPHRLTHCSYLGYRSLLCGFLCLKWESPTQGLSSPDVLSIKAGDIEDSPPLSSAYELLVVWTCAVAKLNSNCPLEKQEELRKSRWTLRTQPPRQGFPFFFFFFFCSSRPLVYVYSSILGAKDNDCYNVSGPKCFPWRETHSTWSELCADAFVPWLGGRNLGSCLKVLC